jgi:3-oxoacid CoA-transferase subunit B
MMTHFSKGGDCKLLRRCQLPLTGERVVDLVVSDLGIFRPTGTAFEIVKLAADVTADRLGGESGLFVAQA